MDIATATTMLLQKACFTNGVTYAPWAKNKNDLEAVEPLEVRDVMECQQMCRCAGKCRPGTICEGKCSLSIEKCELFEYNTASNLCHLMPEKPKGRHIPGDYYISGPPKCFGA